VSGRVTLLGFEDLFTDDILVPFEEAYPDVELVTASHGKLG